MPCTCGSVGVILPPFQGLHPSFYAGSAWRDPPPAAAVVRSFGRRTPSRGTSGSQRDVARSGEKHVVGQRKRIEPSATQELNPGTSDVGGPYFQPLLHQEIERQPIERALSGICSEMGPQPFNLLCYMCNCATAEKRLLFL